MKSDLTGAAAIFSWNRLKDGRISSGDFLGAFLNLSWRFEKLMAN